MGYATPAKHYLAELVYHNYSSFGFSSTIVRNSNSIFGLSGSKETKRQQYIKEADAYAQKLKSTVATSISDLSSGQKVRLILFNKNATTENEKWRTVVGPFKISLANNTKISSITTSKGTILGYTTNENGTGFKKDFNSVITSKKEFYIVLQGSAADGATFTVTTNDVISYVSHARMVIVLNGGSATARQHSGYIGNATTKQIPRSITLTAKTSCKLTVSKQDNKGNAMKGIQFKLQNEKGTKTYGTGTTNGYGRVAFKQLEPGMYYLREVASTVPAGYTPAKDVICYINVIGQGSQPDGQYTCTVINQRKLASLTIKKVDAETGNALKGAEFKIYSDKNCTKLISQVSTDASGIAKLENLDAGATIWVKETKAPTGYDISNPNIQSITLEAGKTNQLIFKNPKLKGSLLIKKTDAESGAPLNNIAFTIKMTSGLESGKYVKTTNNVASYQTAQCTIVTNAKGEIRIDGLLLGNYKIEEVATQANKLYVLNPSQTIVISDTNTSVYPYTLNIPNTPKKVKLKIKKYEEGTRTPLAGAEFTIYSDMSCKSQYYITKVKTDSTGVAIVEGLNAGDTVWVKETKAPDGYELSKPDTKSITLKEDDVNEVEFENSPMTSTLEIIKKDKDTGALLAGAKFGIYSGPECTANQLILETGKTGQNGTLNIETEPGIVYVKELEAPAGYELDTENPKKVNVLLNRVTPVEFKDISQTANLRIIKYDIDDNTTLQGAKFEVYSDKNCQTKIISEKETNSAGVIDLKDLTPGKVYVKETKAPDGYELSTPNVQEVTLELNKTAIARFYNKSIRAGLKIIKRDKETGQLLSGAIFAIYSDQTCRIELARGETNASGEKLFNNLTPGKVYVKEITPPTNYYLSDNNVKEVELKENSVSSVTFDNTIKKVSLQIVKYNEDKSETLEGAKFGIYSGIQCTQNQWIKTVGPTNSRGIIQVDDLRPGIVYYIKEIEAPNGYQLDTNNPKQVILRTDQVNKVEFCNMKQSTSLRIVKLDKNDHSKRLQGAVIGVYSDIACTQQLQKGTTNENGEIVFNNMTPGKVYVKELTPPLNYKLDTTNVKEVTLVAGELVPVEFENELVPSSLKIIKIDKDTNKQLEGAVFNIYSNSDCAESHLLEQKVTNSQGIAIADDLIVGTVWVKEMLPPRGYDLDENNVQEVQLKMGEVAEVTFKNSATRGSLRIIKVDKDNNNKKLEGAEFGVYSDSACTKELGRNRTNSEGVIEFNSLLEGTVYVKELTPPENYELSPDNPKEVAIRKNQVNEVVFEDPAILVSLRITKRDKDIHSVVLAGAEFGVYSDEACTNQIARGTTNNQGIVQFDNLKNKQTYYVKELKAPDGYELSTPNVQKVYIEPDDDNIIEIEFENKIKSAKLKIMKLDEDIVDMGLAGAEFEIYQDKACTVLLAKGKTNEDGILEIDTLRPGTVYIKETKAPDGYELTEREVKEVKLENTQDNTVKFYDKFIIYVNLSGYVWEDIGDPTKEGTMNELYQNTSDDRRDKKVKDIKVRLMKKSNNAGEAPIEKASTETNDKGEYRFEHILLEDLPEYYIEFEYNGMCYRNVEVKANYPANGSKAIEGSRREEYNNKFARISYNEDTQKGQSYDENGRATDFTLTYDKTNYTSKITYGNKENYKKGYDGNSEDMPVSGVNKEYIIISNTYDGYSEKYLGEVNGMTPKQIRDNRKSAPKSEYYEIKNINLGITKRAQPNIALYKDLHKVYTVIPDLGQYVYNYSDRFNKKLYEQYDEAGNRIYSGDPQIKWQNKANDSYSRALYPSDIATYHNDSPINNKLQVYVTYKIGIESDFEAKVQFIDDYYDNKYEYVHAGTDIDNFGNIKMTKPEDDIKDTSYTQKQIGNYQKIRLNTSSLNINKNMQYIYVQLKVKDEYVQAVLDEQNPGMFSNIAEICSYSVFENGKIYAGINKNSQPGNANPNDEKTFEGDTDRAPGLKLVLNNQRTISGIVFEDKTDDVGTNKERNGDGEYKENEDSKITNEKVTVSLHELDNEGNMKPEPAKVYDETGEWKDAITTTKTDGSYQIGGFLPGKYVLKFEWGDGTYKVQEYKGTIYKEQKRQENEFWYQTTDPRYSDAMDNYTTRVEIDKQTNVITNATKKSVEEYKDVITRMDSYTPKFTIKFEYNGTEGTKEKTDNEIAEKPDFNMKNVDFGIAKRAKQILKLNKEVKEARIILTNGSVLANATIEDEKLKEASKNVVYVPESGAVGQVKFEVDEELLQGATIEINYGLSVSNISELDYVDKNYYLYGIVTADSKKVKLKADKIIDYLDNDVASDTDMSKWNIVINNGEDLRTGGLLDNSDAMINFLKAEDKIIVTLDDIDNFTYLAPGEKSEQAKDINIKVSKLLANTTEERDFNNKAEIIKVRKGTGETGKDANETSGGAIIKTTPGNYIPTDASTSEEDNSMSESVIITPPTGLKTNTIAIIILTISSLGILTAGIILIKKYVLK